MWAVHVSALYCSGGCQGIHRSGQTHWEQGQRTQALQGRGTGPTDILDSKEPHEPRNGGKPWLQSQRVSARASVLIWALTDGHPNLVPNRALRGLSEPLSSDSSEPL